MDLLLTQDVERPPDTAPDVYVCVVYADDTTI